LLALSFYFSFNIYYGFFASLLKINETEEGEGKKNEEDEESQFK
jgi:hypothetical protein